MKKVLSSPSVDARQRRGEGAIVWTTKLAKVSTITTLYKQCLLIKWTSAELPQCIYVSTPPPKVIIIIDNIMVTNHGHDNDSVVYIVFCLVQCTSKVTLYI